MSSTQTTIAPTVVPDETSITISIARVVCIAFMMTVHVWPGAGLILQADAPGPLSAIYDFLIGYLGRGAVPLLSVISGYLFFVMLRDRAPSSATVLRRKFETLLFPMILWSAALIAMKASYAAALGGNAMLPQTAIQWTNALFGLTSEPFNKPLAFLRDIFVCVLIALLAYRVFIRSPLAALLLMIAINVADFAVGGVLLLRPPILTFYILGLIVAYYGWSERVPGWPLTLLVLGVDWAFQQLAAAAEPSQAIDISTNLVHRFGMALLMWNLSLATVRHTVILTRWIMSLQPSIFTVFCSHTLTIGLLGAGAKLAGITPADPVYALFLVLQLVVIFIVGVSLRSFLKLRLPFVTQFVIGERTR